MHLQKDNVDRVKYLQQPDAVSQDHSFLKCLPTMPADGQKPSASQRERSHQASSDGVTSSHNNILNTTSQLF